MESTKINIRSNTGIRKINSVLINFHFFLILRWHVDLHFFPIANASDVNETRYLCSLVATPVFNFFPYIF